jgi:LPXTG-motif cell wall-anchored protein
MSLYVKRLSMVAAVLVVTAVLAGPAVLHGDEWNLKTYITVNQPFQVPGAVLEPNTKYVLRRLDGNAGTNHVVRIMNADENKVLTTFMAISDSRLEPADDTVLTFIETAAGYPKPVKSWFYPGRLDGLEFLYSKEQKAEIAAHAPGAQPAVQTAELEETETFTPQAPEATTMPAPSEEQTQVDREKPSDVTPSEPAPTEEEHAAAPEEAAQPEEAPATSSESLPKTGSELPMLALLGLSFLGLGKALRRR